MVLIVYFPNENLLCEIQCIYCALTEILLSLRAKFDVTWHKGDPNYKTSQQVFISCSFCGKSISSLMNTMGRGRQYTKLGGTAHKSKVSS